MPSSEKTTRKRKSSSSRLAMDLMLLSSEATRFLSDAQYLRVVVLPLTKWHALQTNNNSTRPSEKSDHDYCYATTTVRKEKRVSDGKRDYRR